MNSVGDARVSGQVIKEFFSPSKMGGRAWELISENKGYVIIVVIVLLALAAIVYAYNKKYGNACNENPSLVVRSNDATEGRYRILAKQSTPMEVLEAEREGNIKLKKLSDGNRELGYGNTYYIMGRTSSSSKLNVGGRGLRNIYVTKESLEKVISKYAEEVFSPTWDVPGTITIKETARVEGLPVSIAVDSKGNLIFVNSNGKSVKFDLKDEISSRSYLSSSSNPTIHVIHKFTMQAIKGVGHQQKHTVKFLSEKKISFVVRGGSIVKKRKIEGEYYFKTQLQAVKILGIFNNMHRDSDKVNLILQKMNGKTYVSNSDVKEFCKDADKSTRIVDINNGEFLSKDGNSISFSNDSLLTAE